MNDKLFLHNSILLKVMIFDNLSIKIFQLQIMKSFLVLGSCWKCTSQEYYNEFWVVVPGLCQYWWGFGYPSLWPKGWHAQKGSTSSDENNYKIRKKLD
jgi:hypothetical protein